MLTKNYKDLHKRNFTILTNKKVFIPGDTLKISLKKNNDLEFDSISYFKDDKNVVLGSEVGEILRTPGNSFMVEFSKKISFSEKTAFIIHDENILNFDENVLKIYFQNGYLLKNSKLEKINWN